MIENDGEMRSDKRIWYLPGHDDPWHDSTPDITALQGAPEHDGTRRNTGWPGLLALLGLFMLAAVGVAAVSVFDLRLP